MNNKFPNRLLRVFPAVGFLLGFAPGSGEAAVLVHITETVDGVTIQVNGSLLPSSLTEDVPWNSPYTEPVWSSVQPGTRDYLSAGTTIAYRQLVENPADTGILSEDSFVFPGTLSGTGYSIGTTHDNSEVALILERSFPGSTVDYSVFFSGRSLLDFGLSDGDFRQLSFDNGFGGRESVTWTVAVIPEPRSTLLLAIGMGALMLLRQRNSGVSLLRRAR